MSRQKSSNNEKILLFNVYPEVYNRFKIKCLEENKYVHKKLEELIEKWIDEN